MKNTNHAENEEEIKFGELLDQIQICLQQKLYFVAIMACLAIPDIGGAIDSIDGIAKGGRFIKWFDKYVKPRYAGKLKMTGKECYFLRNSMLHQGITEHDSTKVKVAFTNYPQANSDVPLFHHTDLGLLVEPQTFCNNVVYAAYDWLEAVHDTELFKKNMNNFMTLYSLTFTGI